MAGREQDAGKSEEEKAIEMWKIKKYLLVLGLEVDRSLEPVLGDVDEGAVIPEGEDDGVHHTPGVRVNACSVSTNKRPALKTRDLFSQSEASITWGL